MAAPIVLPVDGSSFSEQALPLACDLARQTDSPLHIVQVHTLAHPIAIPEIVPPYEPDWDTAFRIHQREYLARLRHEASEKLGVAVSAALLEGPIVEQLVRYIDEHDARQVVMTSHGRGGLSRAWLGGVASEVVRFVGVPVLLIRPIHTPAEPASVAGMRHILVPLDGSPLAEAILPHVMGIARLSGARVTLVEAVAPVYSISGGAHTADVGIDVRAAETAHNESARYLEHVAGRLRRDHVEADVAVITHWQAAHAIIDYANDHGVDLIAMATHGRGAWSRWVIGSVADKVMRGCHIPMLVLRPADAEVEWIAGGQDAAGAIETQ